jgi:hypothetical protein
MTIEFSFLRARSLYEDGLSRGDGDSSVGQVSRMMREETKVGRLGS